MKDKPYSGALPGQFNEAQDQSTYGNKSLAGRQVELIRAADADPWAHRSEGMRCKTCMWFAKKVASPTAEDPLAQSDRGVGRCRRHAPTMNGYPVVFVSDWCGDHKLDENALGR